MCATHWATAPHRLLRGTLALHGDPNAVDYTPLSRLSALHTLNLDVLADRHGTLPLLLQAVVNPALTALTIRGATSGALPLHLTNHLRDVDMPWALLAAHTPHVGCVDASVVGWRSVGGRCLTTLQSLRLVCDLGVGELEAVLREAGRLPQLRELYLDAWPLPILTDTYTLPVLETHGMVFGCVAGAGLVHRIGVCSCVHCTVWNC